MSQEPTFGIYLNVRELRIVRITSPYWVPEPPEWVYVTDEVNATLLRIRDLIRKKHLTPEPGTVTWGRIPLRD